LDDLSLVSNGKYQELIAPCLDYCNFDILPAISATDSVLLSPGQFFATTAVFSPEICCRLSTALFFWEFDCSHFGQLVCLNAYL